MGSLVLDKIRISSGQRPLCPRKTVQAEWAEIHGRFIDIHQDFDSEQFTDLVWKEWNDPNLTRNQVGWDQKLQRWEFERILHTPQFTQQELALHQEFGLSVVEQKGSRLIACLYWLNTVPTPLFYWDGLHWKKNRLGLSKSLMKN